MWTQILWINIDTKVVEVELQDLQAPKAPYKFLKEWKNGGSPIKIINLRE
jgi:hypothetical protein